jgi:hypothetical protein
VRSSPRIRPESEHKPEGMSIATRRACVAQGVPPGPHDAAIRVSCAGSGRVSPVPKAASTSRSGPADPSSPITGAKRSSSSATGAVSPISPQRSRFVRASGGNFSGSPNRNAFTVQPSPRRSRATTKPSPPLLPGPQITTARRGASSPGPASSGQVSRIASTTPWPARSIRSRPVVRSDAMASCSVSRISAAVRSCILTSSDSFAHVFCACRPNFHNSSANSVRPFPEKPYPIDGTVGKWSGSPQV